VQVLLEAGAQPLAEQGEGWTALHAVCWQGESNAELELNRACERMIDLLVKAGIRVGLPRHLGFTPMQDAAGGLPPGWLREAPEQAQARHSRALDRAVEALPILENKASGEK